MTPSISGSVIRLVLVLILGAGLLGLTRSASEAQEPSVYKTGEFYPPELSQLHQNVLKSILDESFKIDDVIILVTRMNPDGSWDDIDYTSKERGGWQPAGHLSRVLSMAEAYCTVNSALYKQKNLLEKIHLALNFWLENDFQCPNWWYPEIGVPRILNPLMILMESELSSGQKEKGIKILDRAKIGMTGENRVWLSGNVLLKSLLLRDAETVKKAAEAIQSELIVSLSEGVQPDWSYHQHGPQLQIGNYGMAYVDDMISWISLLRNTPFHFDKSKVTILRNYMLEGQQWVTWKNRYDINACGRQVFPHAQESKAASLARCFRRMEQVDPEYAAEYKKAQQVENLTGNRHFWRSDIMIQRSPNYYFSVKMSSERVIGAETVNSENIRGYYAGDGVTLLYQTSKEYKDIFPFWDWRKLPGVTAHQEKDTLNNLSASKIRNQSSFTGGVSDGQNGIAVMKYNRRGLTANKAWFMFNDMVICLGSDITSSAGIPVTTSVNQSFLHGDVVIKTNHGQWLAGKTEDISDPVWLLHDSTGYFFPEGGKLKLEARSTEGSWKRAVLRFPEEKLTADIFGLWLEHGINPAGQSYIYVLVPNTCKADLKKIEKRFPFKIMNLKNRQEVVSRDGKTGGVVFYEPGKSEFLGGIEVDRPCLVMFKKQKNGIHLSVADPSQKQNEIHLKTGANSPASLTIPLPQGGEAGKSVTVILE